MHENDNEDVNKCYIVLFTCASTRGILLEVVRDVSSLAFIDSLRRFIARRGCPRVILSDNGFAFVAKETQEFAVERNINWKFNVAAAPWTGGFFERLVACVKNCIKKTIGRSTLRFDELQTLISEVELTIDSRPLVPMYDDCLEEVVTSNHLIFGQKLELRNTDSAHGEVPLIEPVKRVQYLRTIQLHFWKRWSSEYLTSLREFHKFKKSRKVVRIPEINDIVIIKEEKLPRLQWRLGRVTKLIFGRDNKVRAVSILVGKTGTIIDRPINLVYPLEDDVDKVEPEIERTRREAAVLGEIRRKLNAHT